MVESAQEQARRILEEGATDAARTLVRLATQSESESIQLRATEAILDRIGVAVRRDVSVAVTVEQIQAQAREAIALMTDAELGVVDAEADDDTR